VTFYFGMLYYFSSLHLWYKKNLRFSWTPVNLLHTYHFKGRVLSTSHSQSWFTFTWNWLIYMKI